MRLQLRPCYKPKATHLCSQRREALQLSAAINAAINVHGQLAWTSICSLTVERSPFIAMSAVTSVHKQVTWRGTSSPNLVRNLSLANSASTPPHNLALWKYTWRSTVPTTEKENTIMPCCLFELHYPNIFSPLTNKLTFVDVYKLLNNSLQCTIDRLKGGYR